MKDKGKGAENLIWLAGRQRGADPSLLAADDMLAALTGRIAELEARVSEILAEVDPDRPPVDSKQRGVISPRKPDASRGTDKSSDARVEADAELERASEERRMLANEMRLLREAFQEARRSQLPAGRGANAAEAQIVPDFRVAIADEMRSLLTELLADFRARVPASRPVEHVLPQSEPTVQFVAAVTPIVEEVVGDLKIAPPVVDLVTNEPLAIVERVDAPALRTTKPLMDENVADLPPPSALLDTLATEAAPIETVESIVEHIDELVRPTSKPLIDNYLETPQATEPVAPAGVFPVEAEPAQPAAAIVEDYEEFFRTESPPPVDAVDFEVTPPEPAPPIVDEHVSRPTEPLEPIIDEYVDALRRPETPPLPETFEAAPAPVAPIEPSIDEYLDELREPRESLLETIESSAPAEAIEPVVDKYVEDLDRREPPLMETIEPSAVSAESIEPIIHVEEPPRNVVIEPPAPPSVPDPGLAALWDAVRLPAGGEITPLAQPDPDSFITEEFIAETRSLQVPEEPYSPQELAPHQTIEYVPPPVEFAPSPVEYLPEPPAILEPQWEAPGAPITEPEPAPSFSSLYPELTVADERGLRQIQVVISPIHSFPRLLETERRIRALSTVSALHLRDFRNGVATLSVSVGEAISPAEFGAVIQMLESLHLRLEDTTGSSVELRAEDEPTT